ncbi:MAG: T9SS type A sorting domain-containing protein, partial [Rhodothermales bacterium]
NVEVTENTFVPGAPRADFTITRLDNTQTGTYGLIAASACNATVIDPDLSSDFPNGDDGGNGAFLEAGGMLSVEAEHNTGAAEGHGGGENFSWEATGSFAGSSGDALQAMPNVGANAQDTDRGPRLDYAVNFATPGTYYVWARLNGDNSGSNSVHIGLDGEPATYGRQGLDFDGNGNWQWANRVDGRSGSDRVRVEVTTPGVHTLNLWMREDGTRVDKIVLTTDRDFQPNGNGPAESTRGGGEAGGGENTETMSPVYVNFQRSSTTTPAGYLADTGEAFGDRGDGQSFGWSAANYETRERGARSDKIYDTLNHMQKNGVNKSWEISVPNGEYEVRLVMGDPSYSDQVNTVSVEGVTATDTDGADNYDEHNLVVTVTDGRLTISPAQGASNAKLAFVEITQVGGGAARGAGGASDTAARGEKDDVEASTPYTFALGQNYPNPFNASTAIDIELPEAAEVRLEVFNMLGQRVQVLADGSYEAGPHSFRFDANGLASGTYLYRITTPDNVSTRRMTVVK